jgi:hypothetical protein
MLLLRSVAERQKVVSDPVSDRYLLTCYGGPIDLVHFLQLAADIEAGADPETRLWKEWQAEGGPHFVHWGFDRSEPPEAHPDDLPSNALGALFGSEVRQQAPADLELALRGFFAAFLPLPEVLAAKLSHPRGVMGLEAKATRQEQEARQTWFTARPLLQTERFNRLAREASLPPLCLDFADGAKALRQAGLQLVVVKNQPIRITRLPK